MTSYSDLKSNIYKLYIIKVSHWMLLVMPIMLIFYNANNLSVRHIFLVQAIYSITIVAFELPSGYLADIWGRKNTIMVGAVFAFTGFLVYSFSYSFLGFAFAEFMLGIGQSFVSGSDTAILYDSLIGMKEEDKYIKIEGRMTSVGNFAEAFAGVTGGLLAVVSPRLPFICQAVLALIAIPAAFSLKEPQLFHERNRPDYKQLIKVIKNVLAGNRKLQNNLFLSSVIGASTLTMAWFVQPFFKEFDVPTAIYGILWTVLNASVGFAALAAYKVENKLGETNTTIFIVLACTFGYIATAAFHYFWAISFIFMFYLVRGIATPVLKDYMNKLIPSEARASIISLRNLIIRGIFSSVGPLFGWLTDKISLNTALLMAGLTYFIFSLPLVIMLIGINKKKVNEI